MRFYLGVHRPNWIAAAGVPLFVSRRRLEGRKTFPRATHPWIEDSGAFTELQMHGTWPISTKSYASTVRLHAQEVGPPEAIGIQDWMCEPIMVHRTGLSVLEHQRRTVANFLALREIDPHLPWLATLQGWSLDDYRRCVDMYDLAGVDLRRERLVGVGSVCKRQHTKEVEDIAVFLSGLGLKLHGFGVKTLGLKKTSRLFSSTDSMSWSYQARLAPPLPEHTHKNCANCLPFALQWREKLLAKTPEAY